MLRREFSLALCSLALAPYAAQATSSPSRGPLFWCATRGKARVFILGFGEAKDKAWLTPLVERAFRQSSELWLEVAPPKTQRSGEDAASKRAAEELMETLSHESQRTFFDALEPSVRERTLAYVAELGIKKESIETLRPWAAYYAINSAFWSKHKSSSPQIYADEILGDLAISAGKTTHYEVPTREAFARAMAVMSDRAQSQYIEWLLDFLDDQKRGLNDGNFGWETGTPGEPPERSLTRMRTKMPDLYQVMQVQRNAWWAHEIDELLATNGAYFVGVGLLHVLGPDGIPRQLQRLGIVAPGGLRENPPPEMLG
jgi:uncharacterized protein YbaP (TraB family)